ncbi:MAG: nicotinate (nicotinamide) nucleotide adenylyltransferase [Oscillospiraceae bacterium]|jgi:nicotinate-nucleotide adenylyltransferase|nr:nicotinate (nicotinamide) nucleotide adenylyltransferase [Oscillospiraceae bacterium]
MPKFGLFGGSFDPPHIGHLRLARSAADAFGLDTVFIVPSGNSPGKHVPFADDYDRFLMCEMTFTNDDSRFVIDNRELRRGGVSYTIDTLRELQSQYSPEAVTAASLANNWCLIAGEDCLASFHTWMDYREILRTAFLAIARREQGGAPFKHSRLSPNERSHVRFIDAEPTVISSTELRAAIQVRQDFSDFVVPGVAEFITREGLYRQD